MHFVARPRRFVPVVLIALTVSACAGPDLGKQNFPRTTVTQSSRASAPDGPIDDPAVTLDAQRTVDPCAILQGGAAADVGRTVGDSLYAGGLDSCSIKVTDAGGKEVRLSLQLGDFATSLNAEEMDPVEGLPVRQYKIDEESCTVTAVTSRDPDLGISLQVTYTGGDPCGAGMTALRRVVAKMHAGPPRLNRPSNSLVAVDPCALADDAVVTEVLGRGTTKNPSGLHDCGWSGGTADADLRFTETVEPEEGEDGTAVSLAGGVTAYQKKETNAGARCTIAWTHRRTGDGEGEIVKFEYDNYHDDAAADDSCGKARRIVETILPKLPKS
ncbi:DUF3558 domain-containing protein [Amycolatopsis thermophila]|uniref:DUF3558 domain-containing protein n=1 Tax=Amycolatopsis thermophila TaxID=206084 RepID=A0ABU0ENR9_9PSEU|nr:DUF3558 domain-containing protein [Amycolatopsis thermophila]MDQ0376940.1 hypothetical protein [Amycolatopsis thermophila]